ncbi:MAG: phosphoribosyltransferase family protein [Patescibacteria group bacterium]
MSKKEILKRLHQIGVINKEPVKLRSGQISEFYCDIKKAYGYSDILNAIADEVGKELNNTVTCVAASGYGGLPLAAVVASRHDKNLIAIRNIEKKHGKGGYVDGYSPTKNDIVAIVDDVLTTGSSIRETFSILSKTGAKINSAIVVVKRGEGKIPIPCRHIFSIEEILKAKT